MQIKVTIVNPQNNAYAFLRLPLENNCTENAIGAKAQKKQTDLKLNSLRSNFKLDHLWSCGN